MRDFCEKLSELGEMKGREYVGMLYFWHTNFKELFQPLPFYIIPGVFFANIFRQTDRQPLLYPYTRARTQKRAQAYLHAHTNNADHRYMDVEKIPTLIKFSLFSMYFFPLLMRSVRYPLMST